MSIVPLEHRAGRVISIGRTVLAIFFLAATLIDPPSRSEQGPLITDILIFYFFFSLLILGLTWNRWWTEHLLALPAHIVDVLFFASLVLITGAHTSPYFGFSSFLMIAAAMRWRTRQALFTSLVVAILFLLSAWIGSKLDPGVPVDLLRFVSRGASMVVLAAMILWLWFNQFRSVRTPPSSRQLDAFVSSEPPARDSLLYAAERLSAGSAYFAWAEVDEPWLDVLSWKGGTVVSERHGPEAFPDPIDHLESDAPFLFDCRARRMLYQREGVETEVRDVDPFPPEFARLYGLGSGVALPVRTSRHEAVVIASDIPGLCVDFLSVAEGVRERLASTFERAALVAAKREASAAESRLALARNLHDGAIQFLAGMALKVRSVKPLMEDKGDALRALADIEEELAHQQKDLRILIEDLRQPVRRAVQIDFRRHLASLARRLESRWGISVETSGDGAEQLEMMVTSSYRYQLEQMVGEAASNAVRHGGARRLRLGISREDDLLHLKIEDDGSGFPFAGARSDAELWQKKLGPVSLHQRVRSLGGSLAIASSRTGSSLSLRLPLDDGGK